MLFVVVHGPGMHHGTFGYDRTGAIGYTGLIHGGFLELSSATEQKDLALAYALWALSVVGICGVQRLYLGQPGLGIAMLFTFGFCGIGQVLDLILLPDALNQANRRLGFAKNEVGVSASSSRASVTDPQKSAPVSMPSAQDDELDQLLRQAEQSVCRTNTLNEDS
jgi:TM2 domain-containing membrane protein YozV